MTFNPSHPIIISAAPGDRSHIPESDRFIFEVLGEEMNRVKQVMPVSLMCYFRDQTLTVRPFS